MKPRLILIRGLPGSGKTTLAKQLIGYRLFEADDYFMDASGQYRFDGTKLPEAHEQCLTRTKQALKNGESVAVANTLIRRWEMEPCLALGVSTEIKIASGNFRSVHNVPRETIERIHNQWEA